MAFNKNFNKSNNNGGHSSMSVALDTFWSTDPYALGNGDFQNLRLGIYNNRLTLNFSKGNSKQGSKTQTAYLAMDYESAVIVARTLTYIENIRKDCIKHGVEMPTWSFKNTIQFTDKESKTLRTIGVFEIRTEISQVTQKNTVYISYSAGTDKFDVALGSMYLKDQCEFSDAVDFDVNDSRFYAFADQFRSIVLTWPVLVTEQKMLGIIMNNFGAIRGKMGIPAKPAGSGNGNGKYTDSNYHSGSDTSNEPADDSAFDGDMPF